MLDIGDRLRYPTVSVNTLEGGYDVF